MVGVLGYGIGMPTVISMSRLRDMTGLPRDGPDRPLALPFTRYGVKSAVRLPVPMLKRIFSGAVALLAVIIRSISDMKDGATALFYKNVAGYA